MDTSALRWFVGVIARLLGTPEPALARVSGLVVCLRPGLLDHG